MSSNCSWQHGNGLSYNCHSCMASHPYLCEECQAYLYESLSFDEYIDTTVEGRGHTKTHTCTQEFGVFLTDPVPTLPLKTWEAISVPDLTTDTLYGRQTGFSRIQSMTVTNTSHPRYPSPLANGPETRLPPLAFKNTPHMPGPDLKYNIVPDDTYQSPSSSSPATDIADMQRPTPQADQFRQFRCNHPSKQSPGTICDASFTQNRDLGRHVRSVHALEDEPVYQCRCSYKSARKDNYMRHLRGCAKGHELYTFSCMCGLACGEKMDHVAHLGLCGGHK